jgi:hypothetical protein
VPRVRAVLDAIPSKVLVLRSGRPTEPCVASTGELADRVERVPARIAGATYTGKGDEGHGGRCPPYYERRFACHAFLCCVHVLGCVTVSTCDVSS